jgi:predicted aspartyl protease
MKALRCVALSLGMCCAFSAGRADDCALKQVASLSIEDGHPGRVVVELSIADKPRHFLVDTGGAFTSIYQDVADQLGLSTHLVDQGTEIYDIKGDRLKRYTKVPDLKIGSMKGDDIPVLVEPRPSGESGGEDGTLAPDILSRFDVEFDFANRKMNLFSQDHCEGKVVYWAASFTDAEFRSENMHVVLPMVLDGHNVSATLDTGSAATHLFDNAAQRQFSLDTSSPGMEPIPGIAPGSLEQFFYRFKSLAIGGLAINNPAIRILPNLQLKGFARNHTDKEDFDPQYATHFDTTDMLLGMDVLSKLHLYIAYKEHMIYLTAAGAH